MLTPRILAASMGVLLCSVYSVASAEIDLFEHFPSTPRPARSSAPVATPASFSPGVTQPGYYNSYPPANNGIPEAGGSIGNLPAEPQAPQISREEMSLRLWDAARAGNVGTVASLAQQGADLRVVTRYGETALHAAVASGSLQTVVYLVNSGLSVNATTANGWTPLHHAARFGRTEIANYLLRQGANPHIATRDINPKTPIQMALDNGDLRMARVLGY